MPYSNCPRCGLTIQLRPLSTAPGHCPRCLGRAGVVVPMYSSRGPGAAAANAPPESAQAVGFSLAEPGTGADGLAVKTSRVGDRVTLTVSGELDLAGAPILEDALARAEQLHPARLVLDLSQVGFIDSRGLAALLRASRRFGDSGCQVSLRRPARQARRLFELTGADEVLSFEGGRSAEASQ